MRRALKLIPYLIRALFYAGVVVVTTPLLMLFNALPRIERGPTVTVTIETLLASYPPPRGSHSAETTDADMLTELGEWAQSARAFLELPDNSTLLELSARNNAAWVALDAAGVPSRSAEQGDLMLLADRVRWLAKNRDDAVQAGRHAAEALESRVSELSVAERKLDEAERHLSELHIWLRQTFEADSVAEAMEQAAGLKKERAHFEREMNAARAELAHFVGQRDAEVDQLRAGFMKQRDDAIKDRDFYRDRAQLASAEARNDRDLANELRAMLRERGDQLADAEGRADQLEVEVALLEQHVDCIDDAIPGPDLWADWDLETEPGEAES